jgi:hypothetical protein
MANNSRGEQQGRQNCSVDDGIAEKRLKKLILASLADEYEAKAKSNDGKPQHGTMKVLLNLPTAKALGIKWHAIMYELEKQKKSKQDIATDVPLLTTTNDALETDENTDPRTPLDSQTSTKKVGHPSHADKAAQAKAEEKIQKAVTDATNAFAQMKTDARAVGKKAPDGRLLCCVEEAKAANGIPASITISPETVRKRVARGNKTGQKFQSLFQPIDNLLYAVCIAAQISGNRFGNKELRSFVQSVVEGSICERLERMEAKDHTGF